MKITHFLLAAAVGLVAEGPSLGQPNEKRILIIANKSWEVAPLLDVLLESNARPSGFPVPAMLNHPLHATNLNAPIPRAIFVFTNTSRSAETTAVAAEVWCIQDWMSTNVPPASSKDKMRVLQEIFGWKGKRDPDLVIALGTAAFPEATSYNGSVVMGSTVFVHDPFRADVTNPNYWHDARTERVILPPEGSSKFFEQAVLASIRFPAEARFIAPPMNPARSPILIPAMNYCAVSGINITNYDDYSWADPAALLAFAKVYQGDQVKPPVGCVETTLGLVRLAADTDCPKAPFLFFAAITDQIGHFNTEVAPRSYAQNFTCAHNAGVVVTWLLPKFAAILD